MKEKPKTTFSEAVVALQKTDGIYPARFLPTFSDLNPDDLIELQAIWPNVPNQRKVSVMQDLEDLAEADTITNFDEFAKYCLKDPNGGVRELAIRLLWECEDKKLMDVFLSMMSTDPEPDVQAAAASALGSFVYDGEMEEISVTQLDKVVDALLDVYKNSTHSLVRRRALESLGFCSRDEISPLIKSAYQTGNNELKASALFAMGRSADAQYIPVVKSNIQNPNTQLQLEAVRAAGELDIKKVREELLEMVDSGDLDEEVFYAAVWSLSQLGGNGVKAKFEEIMESEIDDDLADFMETAMENLLFNDGMKDFELFDLEADETEEDEI
jgi:HEAT repeat protein